MLGGRILGAALLLGAGALAVTAIVAAPTILRVARPAAREALRRGMGLYARARVSIAELADDVEDLVAEARSDLAAQNSMKSDQTVGG